MRKKYASKKKEIEERLSQFSEVGKGDSNTLLSELSFCICAANSSAAAAARAQEELARSGKIYSDKQMEISEVLLKSKVRFHNNKAKYIIACRKKIIESGEFARVLEKEGALAAREFLVREADGVGYKEAGHYLRNIGHGENVAILDRHILKNLKSLGVIENYNISLTKKMYLEIEGKMRKFSKDEKIPLSHLDLLFWSEETGRIFK